MKKPNQFCHKEDRLYIAYGSNLNIGQMAHRCPTAKIVGYTILHNWQLLFRGESTAVATIEPHMGSKVPILVWRLQEKDEAALDIYEGYPHLYYKKTLRITVNKRRVHAMVYIMEGTRYSYGIPSAEYFATIHEGYTAAGFDPAILRQAVLDSVWKSQFIHRYDWKEV